MKKYRKLIGKVVTAALASAFVFMSTSTAFASDMTVEDIKNLYTAKSETGEFYRVAEDGMVEYYVENEDLSKVTIEHGMGEIIPGDVADPNAVGDKYPMNWTVKRGIRCVGDAHNLKKGYYLAAAVTVSPTTKAFELGIMDDDGHAWLVRGKGAAGHSFDIPTDNTYWAYVENCSDETIHSCGYYTYNK